MGKVFKVIPIILSCILFFQKDVYAEDGSLKIDTRISESAYQKESFYIEQETELTKLFNEALAKNILEQKEKESISYKKDRALIFDIEIKKETELDNYKKNIFLESQQKGNSENTKIILKEKKNVFNWQNILIIIGAFFVMTLSIVKVFYKKRGA
ncbi:MAG: hypothetical protein E6510_08455 [Gemella haemolysans]|uniref:hypothetical protein n=1 Tax=Gemella haemolysans TaxID=1379 RepID=UPI00290FE138|nr:hypothetical protein [Gemella haemolysans]MDU6574218.1 hypothetical protein [Gemella haemolysans]